jgi:hypothetical protein
MKSIWKFKLEVGELVSLQMPIGSKILSAQIQSSELILWVLVEPLAEKEWRKFIAFGTGWDIEPDLQLQFISTAQDGPFVWHAFEVL